MSDRALKITLIILLAVFGVWAALVIMLAVSPHATDKERSHTEQEWAYETCRYGSSMFYVGRGIDPDTADEYAHRDCDKALEDMGRDQFVWYYSPESAPAGQPQ